MKPGSLCCHSYLLINTVCSVPKADREQNVPGCFKWGKEEEEREEGGGVGDEEANSSTFKELFLREEGVRRPGGGDTQTRGHQLGRTFKLSTHNSSPTLVF